MTAPTDDVLPQVIDRLRGLGLPLPSFTASSFPRETCFIGPADPVAAAAALVAEFDEEDLRTLGLIEESSSGAMALATAFTSESGPLLVVTAPGESAPCALIGEHRTAPLGRLPAELLLGEGYTQDALGQNDNVLVLTQTVAGAVAYRALGVPAAPLERLDGMDPAQRQRLFEVLRAGPLAPAWPAGRPPSAEVTTDGLQISTDVYPTAGPTAREVAPTQKKKVAKRSRKPSAGPAPIKPPPLVIRFAAWSPHDAEHVDEARLKSDAAWCAAAEKYTMLQLGDLAVWLPTPADQAKLSWLAQHGSGADVQRALSHSWAASSFEVSRFARSDFRPSDAAANLIEAYDDLTNAMQGDYSEAAIEAAHQTVRRHGQRQLVQPLYALALETEDPLQRMRYAMAAHEASIGQSLTGELQLALMRRDASPPSALSPQEAALLREYGKSVDRTLRLHKSLH